MRNKNTKNVMPTETPSAKEKFNEVCEICGGIGMIASAVGTLVGIGINVITNLDESKLKKAKVKAETACSDAKFALLTHLVNNSGLAVNEVSSDYEMYMLDKIIKNARNSNDLKEVSNAIKYFKEISDKYPIDDGEY